jgi:hypothetical protein
MKRLSPLMVLLYCLWTPGCGGAEMRTVQELPSPAGPHSGEPFLSGGGNRVYLSWLQKVDEEHQLLVSRWDGTAWNEPALVTSSDSLFVNWADFPSVVPLADGSLAAHWLARAGEGTYAYHVWTATSADDGATWTEPQRLHSDTSPTEHGFVTLLEDGGLAAVWLDGRNSAGGHGEGGEMMVLFGRPGGEETVLDPRVCDCCQTAGAAIPGGLFVAYRDRSAEELRDISYVRRVDGQWSEPRTLHADGWKIPACPVNGPAVAAQGGDVAVAWFSSPKPDGAKDPRVQVAFSGDAGATFGPPVRVSGEQPLGRVDLVWLDEESVLAVWMEKLKDGEAEIRALQVHADGRMEEPIAIMRVSANRSSGFPRLAVTPQGVLVAWTEPGEISQVHVLRIETGRSAAS